MTPRALIPAAVCASVAHGLAALAMLLLLRPGLPAPGVALEARRAYVTDHPLAWALGWGAWHLAGLSLLGLVAALAWQGRGRPALAVVAVGAAAAGLAADLSGQGLALGVQPGLDPASFLLVERIQVVLTAYVANGLYSAGGAAALVAAPVPRGLKLAALPIGLAGVGMSLATLLASSDGLVASAALLTAGMVAWPWGLVVWARRAGALSQGR